MSKGAERAITRVLLWAGIVGFVVSFPLWGLGVLTDWAMLGVTLVLSWAALWYAAFIARQEEQHAAELREELERIVAGVNDVLDAHGREPV